MNAADTRPAWRCEGCGRVSQALVKPHHHRRRGARCGPFAAAVIARDGAVVVAADAVTSHSPSSQVDVNDPLRYRVTTLRAFATGCPRATVLGSDYTTGGIGSSGHRGSAMHAAIAEILRTLWRHNEAKMPSTEDAIAILREVVGRGPWILTPEDMFGVRRADGTTAHPGLVQMIASFAAERWVPSRFLLIEGSAMPFASEGRLTLDIVCPDGEVRMLSGAPDLVVLSPPSSAVIVDHKQSMAKPTQPREAVPEGQPIEGVQYMTDPAGDYAQLCSYGALVMAAYPAIKTVTLKEMSWRWLGNPRVATIRREDLEHILPYLGTVMMQYDQAQRGERPELAEPRAGKTCHSRCSVKRTCPIAEEERGVGAIHDDASADAEGKRLHVVRELGDELRAAVKSHHEATGYCPKVTDELVWRWKTKADKKGRDFGLFAPLVPNDAAAALAAVGITDDDYLAQWQAELEVQQAKAGAAA